MEQEKSRLEGVLSALSAHYFAQEFAPRQLCVNLLHNVLVIKTRPEMLMSVLGWTMGHRRRACFLHRRGNRPSGAKPAEWRTRYAACGEIR
jgi:hypothetical protein